MLLDAFPMQRMVLLYKPAKCAVFCNMFTSVHFVFVASCTGHALLCAVWHLYLSFSAVDTRLNVATEAAHTILGPSIPGATSDQHNCILEGSITKGCNATQNEAALQRAVLQLSGMSVIT